MSYEVKLSQFEGPLDLLLHLIEKAEVDIQDVFVSEITSQYLLYMQQIDELDMESASEFISVAATLLFVKSRALLPRPVPVSDPNEVDPEQALIIQIREYKAFKEAAEQLKAMASSASGVFSRLPEEYPLPPPTINISGVSVEQLYKAFTDILLAEKENKKRATEREVKRDEYTLAGRLEHLRRAIKSRGRMPFSRLFESHNRAEIIVTFMALLELLSSGEIRAEQSEIFGEIIIESAG